MGGSVIFQWDFGGGVDYHHGEKGRIEGCYQIQDGKVYEACFGNTPFHFHIL